MDLSDIAFSGQPLLTEPLGNLDRLILTGDQEDVEVALRATGQKPQAVYLPRLASTAVTPRTKALAHCVHLIRRLVASAKTTQARLTFLNTAAFFGLSVDKSTRLHAVSSPSRLYLATLISAARLAGASFIVANDPFGKLRGGPRASVRSRLNQALESFGLGCVMSTEQSADIGLMNPISTVVLEKNQIADRGDFGQQLATPRSNMAAGIARVNVFSGLARKGWLSIGHSQVKARTELDGKVFVTVPYGAVLLSFDEFDPNFGDEIVFEALVTSVRDSDSTVLATLSPADTEVGLAMTVTLWDFSAHPAVVPATSVMPNTATTHGGPAVAPAAAHRPWGIVHPGLGATLPDQRTRVTTGVRVYAQVDTQQMRAYPVEHEAPTAARTQ